MMFFVLGPKKAPATIIIGRLGMAINMSIAAVTIRSVMPPKYPDTMPKKTPSKLDSNAVPIPTKMLFLAP